MLRAVTSRLNLSRFFITTSADVAAELKFTAPKVVVFTDFEEEPEPYEGDLADGDAIATFIAGASLPLTMEFTDEVIRCAMPLVVHANGRRQANQRLVLSSQQRGWLSTFFGDTANVGILCHPSCVTPGRAADLRR